MGHLYDVASEKKNTAVDNHVLALGALAVATQKRVEAKELLDLATYEHGVALAIWQAALDDLNEKEHTLATEKARNLILKELWNSLISSNISFLTFLMSQYSYIT